MASVAQAGTVSRRRGDASLLLDAVPGDPRGPDLQRYLQTQSTVQAGKERVP